METQKATETWHQPDNGERRRAAYVQLALRGSHRSNRVFDTLQGRPQFGLQAATGGGKFDPPGEAMEELAGEMLFQETDLLTDSSLRQVKFRGRPRELSESRGRFETT